jgi:F-type H+-transporting ATPase subunit b
MRKTKFRYQTTGHRPLAKKNKIIEICFLSAAFCVFSYSAAFSAGGAEHPEATLTGWISTIINFLVLFVILVLAGRKPIKEYFKKRTEMIDRSIKEAEEAKELARKSLEEVRERLKNTGREINEILEAAKKAGQKEKEALIAEGEDLKNKILEQARANIEFELEKARKEIKSEAALMALELAERQIKETLGKEGQETLIDEYIRKLETTK